MSRFRLFSIVLMLVGTMSIAAAQEIAPEAARTYPVVNNSFFNTDIRTSLSDVASETGVTILMDEGVSGFISVDLTEVPLDRALKLMLMPLGLVFKEVEPGVFLVATPDPNSPSFHLISEMRIVPLGYVEPANLLKLLPERWAKYVRPDMDARKAIIEAPVDIMPDIVKYIQQLDTVPKQVMIEAVVIEAGSQAMKQYNLEFATGHLAGNIAGGILNYASRLVGLTGSSGQASFGSTNPIPHDNMLLGLQWLLQNEEGALRANPRIVARDGKQAEIEVGTEEYFSLLTGSAAYAYTRLEKVDATIKLTINPRVLEETGEIICDIEPSVSDVAGKGQDGMPVITVRRAKSTIRVKDGQGIIIGGLLQEMDTVKENKVPILGDLPLIGGLFRSRDNEKVQKEVIIIIAPHIMDEAGNFQGPLLSEVLMDKSASTLAELEQAHATRIEKRKQTSVKPAEIEKPSVSPLERNFMRSQ